MFDDNYGGSKAEASEEGSDLSHGRGRRRLISGKDTKQVLIKALVIALVITIFSLPQIDLISLKNYSLSIYSVLTLVFLFNMVIIIIVGAAYEFAINRRIPKIQVIVGGIVGSLIVSTILSFSWINNNVLVYPFTFLMLTAVLFVTYWAVRELTEPRAYKNVVLFIIVILLVYLAVKYLPPIFGAIANEIPKNVTSGVGNALSHVPNVINQGISNLSRNTTTTV